MTFGRISSALSRTVERIWEIHFLMVFLAYLPISLFEEMYRELFGEETAFDAYRLVQGFDNLTLQTARVLWGLSREALQIPRFVASWRRSLRPMSSRPWSKHRRAGIPRKVPRLPEGVRSAR